MKKEVVIIIHKTNNTLRNGLNIMKAHALSIGQRFI